MKHQQPKHESDSKRNPETVHIADEPAAPTPNVTVPGLSEPAMLGEGPTPQVVRGRIPLNRTTQAQLNAQEDELGQLTNARKALKEIIDVLDRHPELRLWTSGNQMGRQGAAGEQPTLEAQRESHRESQKESRELKEKAQENAKETAKEHKEATK